MNKLATSLESQDLLDALEKIHPLNGTCQITILNGTPPDWRVSIAAAGIKFFYSDGTDYTDGPRPINLGPNQTATFQSNKSNGCVVGYFAAVTIVVDGQSDTKTDNYTEEPNKCLAHATIRLGPATSSVSEVDLGKPLTKSLSMTTS